jgi:hypothetical protein
MLFKTIKFQRTDLLKIKTEIFTLKMITHYMYIYIATPIIQKVNVLCEFTLNYKQSKGEEELNIPSTFLQPSTFNLQH